MVSTNEVLKTKEIADKALKRIESSELAPTPQTYALWYQYYAESNFELGRAVDVILRKSKKLSEQDCAELYQKYINEGQSDEMILKAEATVAQIMEDVAKIITGAQTNTGSYGNELKKTNQSLGKVQNINDLKKVVTDMVATNKEVLAENQNLEQELSQSTKRMDDLKQEVEHARAEAKQDALTNLLNRKGFDVVMKESLAYAKKESRAMSLLLMDIDHFKKFNDTYGHQVGDQVLKLVGRTLIEGIKGKDTAARYGGEEFAVILPETNMTAAIAVANALRRAIANKELVNKNTGETLGRITISVGAAESVSTEKPEEIIERADKALYMAKQSGRDRVCVTPKPDVYSDSDQYTA